MGISNIQVKRSEEKGRERWFPVVGGSPDPSHSSRPQVSKAFR
jgi:hypothetical protein